MKEKNCSIKIKVTEIPLVNMQEKRSQFNEYNVEENLFIQHFKYNICKYCLGKYLIKLLGIEEMKMILH